MSSETIKEIKKALKIERKRAKERFQKGFYSYNDYLEQKKKLDELETILDRLKPPLIQGNVTGYYTLKIFDEGVRIIKDKISEYYGDAGKKVAEILPSHMVLYYGSLTKTTPIERVLLLIPVGKLKNGRHLLDEVENKVNAILEEDKKKEYDRVMYTAMQYYNTLRRAGILVEEPSENMSIEYLRKKIDEWERLLRSLQVKVDLKIGGNFIVGEWCKGNFEIQNIGDINLEDVSVNFESSALDIDGENYVGSLEKKGKKVLSFRMKSKDSGYVPLEVKVSYKNPLNGRYGKLTFMPEIYVAKALNEPVMLKPAGAFVNEAAGEKHIPLSRIKKMYGIEDEEEYKWGEFDSYEILGMIGSGGFSVVYEVKRGRKKYAMKIPKGVDWKLGETLLLREEDMRQYGKEALIWAMLTERVPHAVINLIDAGVHPFPWFVMELGENSLASVYKRMGSEERMKVAVELLGKLDKIHRLNVVHKDIKPENILYAGGEWKFTDFGLSKIVNKSSKSSQMLSGTLLYMAPEQISKKKFGGTDWRTDIWQMGVMIYELLTGHLPFEAEDAWEITGMILRDEPVPATEYGVSEEVWRVIEKALQKNKEKRWQSAAEMKDVLLQILSNENRR